MIPIQLVIPPYNDELTIPELSLPQMTAYLRAQGVGVRQIDLNQLFIHLFKTRPQILPRLEYEDRMRRLKLSNHQLDFFIEAVENGHPLYDRFFESAFLKPFLKSPAAILGISVIGTAQLFPAGLLAKRVKQARPETRIIIGGPWTTTAHDLLPDFLKAFSYFDGAVTFAGERPLLELARSLENGEDGSDIAGFHWRLPDGTIQVNPPQSGVPLQELPVPEFRDLDLSLYPTQLLPVATRLGCYWGHCLFCHHHVDWKTMTERPVEQVVDQIQTLIERHGLRRFVLSENTTHPETMAALSEELLRRKLDVEWVAMSRAERHYTPDLAKLLYRAGCRYLWVGMETVSQEILQYIHKGTSLANLENMIACAHPAGIGLNMFLIDIPGFPEHHLHDTIDWVVEHREQLHGIFMQRFALARNNAVYRDPDLLNIRLTPQAATHLDVFDIPYTSEDWMGATRFWELIEDFRTRFYGGRTDVHPEEMFWHDCEREWRAGLTQS